MSHIFGMSVIDKWKVQIPKQMKMEKCEEIFETQVDKYDCVMTSRDFTVERRIASDQTTDVM